MSVAANLSSSDYQFFSDVLKEKSGLVLGLNKVYLLESRLAPLCKSLGFKDLSQLAYEMRFSADKASIIKKVCCLMTTNESLFFRDKAPFEHFQKHILKYFHEARSDSKKLRIWSAACSTGQEAYSIAMCLEESDLNWKGWDIQIFGTDICDAVLERAREGSFSSMEVARGLPDYLLSKYFDKGEGNYWLAKDVLKKYLNFKIFNLLDRFLYSDFDIIFLRNVLIYFDKDDKEKVLDKVYRHSAGDSVLFLGAAESTFSIYNKWTPIQGVGTAIFEKEKLKV